MLITKLCNNVFVSEINNLVLSFKMNTKTEENKDSPKTSLYQRFLFYKCSQEETESVSDFILKLENVLKTCNFRNSLEALRDKFIFGLKCNKIQSFLLEHEDITFFQAKQIALKMESDNSKENETKEKVTVKSIKEINQDDKQKKQSKDHCDNCVKQSDSPLVSTEKLKCFACHIKKTNLTTSLLPLKKNNNLVKEPKVSKKRVVIVRDFSENENSLESTATDNSVAVSLKNDDSEHGNSQLETGNNQYIPLSEVDIYSRSSSSPWHSSISPHSQDSNSRPTPPVTPKNNNMNSMTTETTTGRRNMGGRKPVKDLNLTPEEEERRKIRRERNKQAAARCRKRRVDHTNLLIAETEALEQEKQRLQNEIQEMKLQRDSVEYCLHSHICLLRQTHSPPDVKPYGLPSVIPPVNTATSEERVKTELIETLPPHSTSASTTYFVNGSSSNTSSSNTNNNNNNNHTTSTAAVVDYFTAPSPAKRIMLSSTVPIPRPNRPSSLNVSTIPSLNLKSVNVSELAGVPITTPTTGIQLNFDSMMVGGTGLTPVQCSAQQRNNGVSAGLISDVVGSPDACGGSLPPKLVSL